MTDEIKSWPEPRANSELIGFAGAEKILLESAGSGRMPHAWLICGPQGIGKATLAFRFARFLLAGGAAKDLFGGEGLYVDPESPLFRRVASGGHADLLTVEIGRDPKSGRMRGEIVVDDVRDVSAFLHLTPAEGGYRVVVVDAVDAMNRNAANALLKILEEPPPQSVLLLVCHAPGRVLATIRSRCRKLVLRPLGLVEVTGLLARYLPEIDAEDRAALARLGEGSPGRALALATEKGLEMYREMVAVIGEGNPARLHRFCEKFARADEGFRTASALYLWWLARAIRIAAGLPEEAEIVDGERAACARIANGPRLDRFVGLWEKAERLFARAESVSLDRKQVMMSALGALADEAA